ncbi:MAG: PKD domain-containing protein [Bacteroidales bacterium]|nr:PKD domain-containing protein [Bacteroidales bacterium]
MKKLLFIFLSGLILPQLSIGQVISDFELGTDNWHSEGDGDYYWEASNGNPGGCFRVDDDATGDWNNGFAPVKFLGDWSAATVSDYVSADIFVHQLSGSYSSATFVFQIKGPGGEARAFTPVQPPLDVWNNYTAHLDPTEWTLISGDWNLLLQQVSELIVRTEYISGDEYVRLDNVILSITPAVIPVTPVICSDFEEGGYDGWSFASTGGVSNYSSGGNPGRCIRITDGSGISKAFPPPKYLGDWSQLDNHGADIRMDIKITNYSGTLLNNDYFIRISGPGGAAKFLMDNTINSAYDRYKTFVFPVDETYWVMESGTWSSLVSYVNSFEIVAEFLNASEIVWLDNFCISDLPPVADFGVDLQTNFVGNPLQFSDQSAQGPTSWNWDFGDGQTATDQHPTHVYNAGGLFDIELTASNYFGNDSELKSGFIEILPIDQCLKYEDDFNDNIIDPSWWIKNGTWSEANGNIRQTSNYYESSLLGGCFALTGSFLWEDYVFSGEMMSSDNDNIGFVFNWQDEQNMYMFDWELQTTYRHLVKWENGVQTILASDNIGYTANQWYNFRIYSINNRIIITIDGIEIFDVEDNTFTNGKAGLFCSGNQSSYWDNYKVECPGANVDLRVFLEGPFNGTAMNTDLNNQLLIPLSNPYTAPPWNHLGSEGISAPPESTVVDWVLVEFRDASSAAAATPATSVGTYAALLLNNGDIVSPYNYWPLYLNYNVTNQLFAVIYHRNHLSIMSSSPLIEVGGDYTYDFTLSAGQAYGTAAQKDLGNGNFGMFAGDFDANGVIDNNDKSNPWGNQAGGFGYLDSDGNLNGQADNLDKNDQWKINYSKSTQVPQ